MNGVTRLMMTAILAMLGCAAFGMAAAGGRLIVPRELPHQRPILLSSARFKLLVCGRRWSKTDLALQASLLGHGPHRGARRGAIDGGNIWWIGLTNKQAARNWRALKRSTKDAWVDKNEQLKRIELPGGGAITVLSAEEPDNIRGDGPDGVVLDEAAFMSEYLWTNVVRPALIDRRGWAIFPTTPNGFNWFKDLFDAAPGLKDWARWQQPSHVNALLSKTELEDLRAEVERKGGSYEQEILAQFTQMEGAVFPSEWFDETTNPKFLFDVWPDESKILAKAMALDPSMGRSIKSDYSAIVWGAVGVDGHLYVDADIRRRDPTRIVHDCAQVVKQFGPRAFGIEDYANQFILAPLFQKTFPDLAIPIVPIKHADVETDGRIARIGDKHRILSLSGYLRDKELRFKKGSYGAQLLIDQLRNFGVKGIHDDGPDALEMLVRLAMQLVAPPAEGDGLGNRFNVG